MANYQEILITGAGGELGHRVVEALKKQGHKTIGVDFRQQSHYDDHHVNYRLDFSKRSFQDVFKKHNIDAVIHLGRIQSSVSNRFTRYNTNVLGTQWLFDLSHKYNVKQVTLLSTFHVYGAHPYNPILIDEHYPLKAANLSSELVDAVELENLAAVYMLKYPHLNITVLRPCNVVGPGVQNSTVALLEQPVSSALLGFSPIMQFIHVEDLSDAILLSFHESQPGVYNVAPDDWVPYQNALHYAGCKVVPIPSIPPSLPKLLFRSLKFHRFPTHLINYYKYPVILDSSLFKNTFDFEPKHRLKDIFHYYASLKGKS